MRLIEDRDGVVWQGEITSAMDWSASTTSRRLAAMEEQGHVNRYQIGRRNLVCLPGHEPAFLHEIDRRDGVLEPAP